VKKTALFFALSLFIADFFLKNYVQSHLALLSQDPYAGILIFRDWHGIDFQIVHHTNTGAAWGLLAQYQQPLLYARIAIIGGIVTTLIFNRKSSVWAPLLFIAVGAIGNVIDTFRFGHVVDMFLFYFWGYQYPVFNIADSAIFLGISWILIQSLLQKGGKRAAEA
jgi:signal peptidase II